MLFHLYAFARPLHAATRMAQLGKPDITAQRPGCDMLAVLMLAALNGPIASMSSVGCVAQLFVQ